MQYRMVCLLAVECADGLLGQSQSIRFSPQGKSLSSALITYQRAIPGHHRYYY